MSSSSQPPHTNDSVAPQDLTTRTIQSLLWLLSSNAVGALARLAVVPILARLLAPEVFGITAAASIVTGFAYIFASVGIGPTIIRLPDLEERHTKTGLTISVLLGLGAGSIAFLLAPWIAEFFNNPQLIPVLRVQSLLFPLRGLTVVCESMMQRELAFRRFAMIESLAYVVGYCLVAIGGALAGWGVWAIVLGAMSNNTLRLLLVVGSYPQYVRFGFDMQAARSLFRDGSGFTAMQFLSFVGSQIDYLVVGRLLGLEALGLYTKAYELISRIAGTLTQTIRRPLFAGLVSIQSEQARMRRVFLRGSTILGLLIIPLIPVAVVLSPEIILIVLGNQWTEAIIPFGILVGAMFFILAARINLVILQARGLLLRGTLYYLYYLVAILLGAWSGHFWGIIGVSAGVVIALFSCFLLSCAIVLRNLEIGWGTYFAAYGRSVLLAGLSLTIVWPIAYWMRTFEQPLLTALVAGMILGTVALLLLILVPKQVFGSEAEFVTSRAETFYRSMRTRLFKRKVPAGASTGENH